VKREIAEAIEEIERAGVGTKVASLPDPDGGAFVRVHGVEIGDSFEPASTWIAFQITWGYPDADCYPHFISHCVKYVGSGPAPNQYPEGSLPTSMSRGARAPGFDLPAVQISRASRRRNAETDSALQKLLRIIEFLRSR
jgi:hypothetical protein